MELRPSGDGKVAIRVDESDHILVILHKTNNVLSEYYHNWMRKNVRTNVMLKFKFLGIERMADRRYAMYKAYVERIYG